jgi:phage major head subunit gpT-like protein
MGLKQLSSRDVIGQFFEALEAASGVTWIPKVSMLFPSNQQFENYKWLGFSPALRRWIGERQAKGLRVNGITIENLLYEGTLGIDVDDIRRDKTGQIKIRIGEQVDEAISHWATLLTALIQNAESSACYDGQFFFDTDHQEGDSPAQSNDLSASDYSELNITTPTNPTANELANVIMKMIQHMYTLKNDQNRPMNRFAKQFLVMVPVSFFGAAQQAIFERNLETGAGVRNNPLAGLMDRGWRLDVEANPELTWTDKLAVFRTDGRAKPFIRQAELLDGASQANDESLGIQVQSIAEGSEEEFKNNQWLFGIKASRNVGYGYWQHGVLGTLS